MESILQQIQALVAALQDAQAALEAEKQKAYEEGFAAGVASLPSGSGDKIYSQEDVDLKIAEAIVPLKGQVDELVAKVSALEAEKEVIGARLNKFNAFLAELEADEASDTQRIADFKAGL